MTVMVCAAHPDDEVIGVGGTIAKLSMEGEDVITVLFSYGDKFPFWEKPLKVRKKRMEEFKKCEKILGVKDTYLMGYHDLEIHEKKEEAVKRLVRLIRKYKPSRVFTHTVTDGHPDHRAVYDITTEAVKKSLINTQILTFGINFFNFQKGVRIVYDISKSFSKKMEALNEIKSQRLIIMLLKPLILLKAITCGLQNNFKYGECFVLYERNI